MKRALLFLLPILMALVPGVLVLASCRAPRLGLVDGRLRPCPDTPNCACSEEPGEAFIAPLSFRGEAAQAFDELVAFLRGEPRVELVTVEPGYVHAVYRTPLLRFRDDVEFRLDPEAHVIHVRSASRVGYSDLGANRERIESIRTRWVQGG